MTTTHQDACDYRLELAQHVPSGDVYLLQYTSTWDEAGECVGWTYTACVGPLFYGDWQSPDGTQTARADWLAWGHDVLDGANTLELALDLEWANEQQWTSIITQPRALIRNPSGASGRALALPQTSLAGRTKRPTSRARGRTKEQQRP